MSPDTQSFIECLCSGPVKNHGVGRFYRKEIVHLGESIEFSKTPCLLLCMPDLRIIGGRRAPNGTQMKRIFYPYFHPPNGGPTSHLEILY